MSDSWYRDPLVLPPYCDEQPAPPPAGLWPEWLPEDLRVEWLRAAVTLDLFDAYLTEMRSTE